MSLRLRYHGQTTVPVEVEGLLPAAVRGKPLAEVEKWPIHHGNQQLPLAEFFQISGDAGDNCFDFEGNLSGVHWIGAHLSDGTIHVVGNAGRHIGSEMRGGQISVEGDASDWVGGEMHGGLIRVAGSAGNHIGGAYPGSPVGMTGGTILIGGDVGNEIGHSMRRGLLAVGGACGDFPALNLLAGSVFVFGGCGLRPAAGMRRGTLALFGEQPPPLLPTFRSVGVCQPQFMRVYLLQLQRLGFAAAQSHVDAAYEQFDGDLVTLGRGEVFIRR